MRIQWIGSVATIGVCPFVWVFLCVFFREIKGEESMYLGEKEGEEDLREVREGDRI